MRLGNILSQAGGVPETGRPVRFQIRVAGRNGSVRRWCDAMIVPLSEDERSAAIADAREHCASNPKASPATEEALRLAQRFLVDPENSALKFIAVDELPRVRSGLIGEQLVWLVGEYDRHILEEYPELSPQPSKADLEAQIEKLRAQLQALAEEALGESQPAQD